MDNNTLYKDSALGRIPRDWDVKRIADYGKVFTGNTPPTDCIENYGNEFMFVSPSDLSSEKFIKRTEKRLSLKGFSISRKFTKGSVLFTCIGSTIGKSGIVIEDSTSNQQINAIVVDKKDNNEFLYYVLEFISKKIKLLAGEQAVPILNKSQFEAVKIICPPLPEQNLIAELLSTWDKAISNVQSTIEQVQLRNKWLMQELLTGKRRLKGFSGEWKEVKMKEVFERITRKNSENNTNVVTISAQRGFIKQTDYFNKNIASEITDNYYLVKKGEFCYNKSYSNGYPWGATKRLNDYDNAVVTTLYICFKIKKLNTNSGDFFEQYLEKNLLDRGLTKIAHEGGRAHGLLNVTPSDFFDLSITIPGFDEQTAIAVVLQAADREVQLVKSKLEKLKEQKKGLMQVLLTGKKRLKVV